MPRTDACRLLFLSLFLCIFVTAGAQQSDTLTVYFDYNKSVLTPTDKSMLDTYFSAASGHFTFQHIELNGHCDSIGGHQYNDSLSLTRVKSVKDYLDGNQLISSAAFAEKGLGKRSPLNNNSTSAYRSLNRRVEIILQKSSIEAVKVVHDTIRMIHDTVFTKREESQLYQKLTDTSLAVGSNIILQNINFYGGRHLPVTASYAVMKDLLRAMLANMQLKIEIDGHVCCEINNQDGDDIDTRKKDLSVQRAKFIYDYLVENGINKHRMSYKGFGSSHKLYPDEMDEREKLLNRRVEIKIISK